MLGEITATCQEGIREACVTLRNACEPHVMDEVSLRMREYESEFGRMIYTISILIMFSFVIILLMVRSIKRTHSTVEMDALLDAMRFREELDIRDRQRRRLMKAKTKVSAWLNRAQNAALSNEQEKRKDSEWKPPPKGTGTRPRGHYSISTVTSDIPEIVVSADDCTNTGHPMRPHTPAISLIYDFGVASPDLEEQERRKTSLASTAGLPISSSSSSLSSVDQKMSSMKTNPRTFSLDTSASTTSRTRRVDVDDKSFSLDT
ncbi:unnamed protein product [Caenorhabditis sp. 36 PRJEB53466]|nr:unnamed protein product [Caenorhabditis sp. 36 PRJEB53466]